VPAGEKMKTDAQFVTLTALPNLNRHGKYELVEMTIAYGNMEVLDLLPVIRTKLTHFGRMNWFAGSNSIVICDLADNLREIAKTTRSASCRPTRSSPFTRSGRTARKLSRKAPIRAPHARCDRGTHLRQLFARRRTARTPNTALRPARTRRNALHHRPP